MTSFANKTRRAGLALAALTVAGGLAAVTPAHAQTVADYEEALAQAARASDVDSACRPLVNYAFVSIGPADQACASPVAGLLRQAMAGDDPSAPARAACLARLTQPVIAFDGGLGEDIVPLPAVEDPNKPLGEQRPSY